ncbi:Fc.00g074780.m01.CDS01 [Cosmosporella sp. VM-42]
MVHSIFLPSGKVKGIKRRGLIYFICGNPGLIHYYTDFFHCLRGLLQDSEGGTAYDIYGRNLLGFSDDDHEPFGKNNEPWDLEGQIEGIYADVAARRVQVDDEKEKPYDFVILMGHSVGAYISVEICHRHMKSPERQPHLNLQYGFLLFPTLTHIAQSPSGTRVEFFRRNLPIVDKTAHIGAQMLLKLFSESTLRWIIETMLGFTPLTASVTANWLKSRDGVWQSIHLGISELETIRDEQWEEELWEVAEEHDAGADTPKFFIFYGKNDHWVANRVRDDFIQKRMEHGERGGRTKITVDEGDIPHAFCTKGASSWAIATKVNEWIREIETNRVVTC